MHVPEHRGLRRHRPPGRHGLAVVGQVALLPHRPREGTPMTDQHPSQQPAQRRARLPADPALLRGLTAGRSRRDVLQAVRRGRRRDAAEPPAAASRRRASKADTSKSAIDKYWAAQKETGQLVWANWPLYLDTTGQVRPPQPAAVREGRRHPGQVRRGHPGQRPVLRQGAADAVEQAVLRLRPGGDHQRHLLQQVPRPRVPRPAGPEPADQLRQVRRTASSRARHFDPGNVFSVPWQAGFTGIGYNPAEDRPGDHQLGGPAGPEVQGPHRDDRQQRGPARTSRCWRSGWTRRSPPSPTGGRPRTG